MILFDFEDSFTYNIYGELKKREINVDVVSYKKMKQFVGEKNKRTLIYGPGPGHINDYKDEFSTLNKLLNNKNIYHMGICLGHQLISHMYNKNIVGTQAVHGEARPWTIPSWEQFPKKHWGKKTYVQRYNSWAVRGESDSLFEMSFSGEDCYCARFPRGISYQFHPESCGTFYPSIFFEILKNNPYN